MHPIIYITLVILAVIGIIWRLKQKPSRVDGNEYTNDAHKFFRGIK